MSLEHSPARSDPGTPTKIDSRIRGPPEASDYWQALIDEKAAGDFVGLKNRTMQALRQRGGGPRYFRLSSRCLRYRRVDLRKWAEARMRSSTSDPGQGAA